MRELVGMLLSKHTDIELVAEAANARDAISELERQEPDVAVVDFRMPDLEGAALIATMTRTVPTTQVIVVSALSLPVDVDAARRAGAKAYLAKHNLHRELIACIRAVHAGESWDATPKD